MADMEYIVNFNTLRSLQITNVTTKSKLIPRSKEGESAISLSLPLSPRPKSGRITFPGLKASYESCNLPQVSGLALNRKTLPRDYNSKSPRSSFEEIISIKLSNLLKYSNDRRHPFVLISGRNVCVRANWR